MNSIQPKLDVIALREEWRKLPDYGCWWSSPDNERGLQLTPTIKDGKLSVDMKVERHHSGFPGIAHGGLAYTILDGLMGWWLMAYEGRAGFTTTTTTRYKGPMMVGQTYRLEAESKGEKTARGEITLVGRVFSPETPKKILVEVQADFFMPNLDTAEKVMGLKLGEVEGRIFPKV
jgi:acyl-coenzyme A thioesterase PaaI-like protein